MTEQEQRMAIAEACGFERWKGPEEHDLVRLCKPRNGQQRDYWISCGCRVVDAPVDQMRDNPDYLHDLNAMKSARESLHPAEIDEYACNVKRIVARDWAKKGKRVGEFSELAWLYAVADADASQHAEAFLRTKDKWKE